MGRAFPVTFAKYTGDTAENVRGQMRRHPPQIMLTNYVMAELLLVRPEDQRFLERAMPSPPTPLPEGEGRCPGSSPRGRGEGQERFSQRERGERVAGCGFWCSMNCTLIAAARGRCGDAHPQAERTLCSP